MKIHIKRFASDRVTLCGIWAEENWVLKELMGQQPADMICKICGIIAARIDP